MPSRTRGLTAVWLLVLALAQVGALAAVWWIFVRTAHGQVLDGIALEGNAIGRSHVHVLVTRVLDAITVLSLAVATAVIGFIALARRRIVLAVVATLLVAGANVTTQILKFDVIHRPDLGIPGARIEVNSLPSGHTTVAASVAVALVLVLPPRLRGLAAMLGAGYAGLTGIATLAAGWHRPSDSLAALLVVGAWAAGAGVILVLTQRRNAASTSADAHPYAVTLLALIGVGLLVIAVVGLGLADPPQLVLTGVSRRRLFAAYAGGAAGIAGTACLVMTVFLATVHRVVPRWGGPPRPNSPIRIPVTTGPR
ncbi:phosphatase PAP2 family protein [Actinopolymorpha alba]|uniref:phosphatase PAP2 family protein n=1 Tax=Actinopolymorpha alba TaxID=533267 RepID=UPI000687703A|nr:phosphatase PAP2 family protein [Actinopolymorpha alba]